MRPLDYTSSPRAGKGGNLEDERNTRLGWSDNKRRRVLSREVEGISEGLERVKEYDFGTEEKGSSLTAWRRGALQ